MAHDVEIEIQFENNNTNNNARVCDAPGCAH